LDDAVDDDRVPRTCDAHHRAALASTGMMRVLNTRPTQTRRHVMQAQMSQHPALVSAISFIAVFYIVAGSALA
jgi:hypothetical protein